MCPVSAVFTTSPATVTAATGVEGALTCAVFSPIDISVPERPTIGWELGGSGTNPSAVITRALASNSK